MTTTTSTLKSLLEELAGQLLAIDAKDLPELARMHTLCESLTAKATDEGHGDMAKDASGFVETIARIIHDKEAQPAKALEQIVAAIDALQTKLDAPQVEAPAAQIVDLSLVGDFVSESREHLESANVHLLTLETDPHLGEDINAVFRAFHTIKGVAGFLGFAAIQSLAHEAENVLDQARKERIELVGPALDTIFDATDALKALVDDAEKNPTQTDGPDESVKGVIARLRGILTGETPTPVAVAAPAPRLGEILVQSGIVSPQELQSALASQQADEDHPRLGEVLVREHQVPVRDVVQALRTQKQTAETGSAQVRETIKVDAERLERLVDMIGELVITESMVSQLINLRGDETSRLNQGMGQLDKITRELQEMGTSLRMVPLRSTFQKMSRLVRDLGKKSGKPVDLILTGEDTELDKTVVDKLSDPLVHMIRNAVDHGLEGSAAERVKAGKPETGRVELRAFHRGGSIYIEIADDGRGLNRDAILAKGRERGLVRDGETPSEREILNLIFQPGFSTAKAITDVSGRGVGMDVVRRNIDALRGQIDISTVPGQGSTFCIRLPLTLAIIDGMVVRVGAERYVIPTLSVVRALRPEASQCSSILGRGEALTVQGELLPLFRLGELFSIGAAAKSLDEAIVVVIEEQGHRTGLLVDELLGQQQIVIKSLGAGVQGVPGVTGGAIMPDGHVGLILDVGGIVRLASA